MYHIAQNHPFVDGNKRTTLAAALTFLELNDHPVLGGEDELEAATWKVAAGKIDKKSVALILKKIYIQSKNS
jgi:death-on-curing protein